MSKINSSKLKFLTVLALTMTIASVAFAAAAFFYQSPGSVGGKPKDQIGALWQQWALKNPKPTNVILDKTGAQCGQNQPGYTGNPATNIWWLAGTDGGAVTRTCTVPLTRTLVFPVVTNTYFGFATDTPAEIAAGVADVVATANAATGLSVTYDGAPLANPKLYLTKSAPFSVKLPANNIYDLPANTVLSPNTDVGYYVGVTVYVPGQHTLKFKGTIAGQSIDVTYKLNVKVTPF